MHSILNQICKFAITRKNDAFLAKIANTLITKVCWPFLPSQKGCQLLPTCSQVQELCTRSFKLPNAQPVYLIRYPRPSRQTAKANEFVIVAINVRQCSNIATKVRKSFRNICRIEHAQIHKNPGIITKIRTKSRQFSRNTRKIFHQHQQLCISHPQKLLFFFLKIWREGRVLLSYCSDPPI